MASKKSGYFEMQESCSTPNQTFNDTINVTNNFETQRDDAIQTDNTNPELPLALNMRKRDVHNRNIPTNYDIEPAEVSETSPNKRIFVCLIALFAAVVLSLVLAVFSIIKIHAIGDGVSNTGIRSTTMPKQEQQKGTGSSSYIRWGRSGCPNETAEIAYTGYAAGSFHNYEGSGANYLCLHETPQYDRILPAYDSERARFYGVEYQVSNFPPFASQHNHDMNCAVCRVATRGTMIMIPARLMCPSGWTREYYGYLMSSRWDQRRTEYICVDRNPEAVQETHETEAGSAIYVVESRCLNPDPKRYTGGLPCDKFPDGNELSCVVCTK